MNPKSRAPSHPHEMPSALWGTVGIGSNEKQQSNDNTIKSQNNTNNQDVQNSTENQQKQQKTNKKQKKQQKTRKEIKDHTCHHRK